MRSLTAAAVAALTAGAVLSGCGGGDGPEDAPLASKVRRDPTGVLDVSVTKCELRGGRELRGEGTVRNTGEKPYNVQLSVRFIDGDGTRVEIASDSVSNLESGESARWNASAYSDAAPDAKTCEVSATGP